MREEIRFDSQYKDKWGEKGVSGWKIIEDTKDRELLTKLLVCLAVPVGDPLPCLYMATFLLFSHGRENAHLSHLFL